MTCHDGCSRNVELRTLDRATNTTIMDFFSGKSFNKLNFIFNDGGVNRDVLLFGTMIQSIDNLIIFIFGLIVALN